MAQQTAKPVMEHPRKKTLKNRFLLCFLCQTLVVFFLFHLANFLITLKVERTLPLYNSDEFCLWFNLSSISRDRQ